MKASFRLLSLALTLALVGPMLSLGAGDSDAPVVRVSATLIRTAERTGQLSVTADVKKGFHIYAQTQPRPFLATALAVTESPTVRVTGAFTPSRASKIFMHPTIKVELHEHEGQVTWTAPVEIFPSGNADIVVRGTLFAQACEEGRCLAPQTYPFEATLAATPAPASTKGVDGPTTGGMPAERFSLDRVVIAPAAGSNSVWAILALAFLAGLLLNLMPCVLPVVGLKLLSFVQQADHCRRRVLLLNVAYAAGLMSVMLVLASLAVFAGLGWGEQFSNTAFSVTLAALVFAFALSFLGVWEIPVPGFVGAADASTGRGEGYAGAFSKGVISTLLATPCSGPFLGSALAWAVAQPAILTYAVFVAVGLGMASPYLIIGLFPRLVRVLPRPGAWMLTFKQLMGFVLLATVVFLMSFLAVPSVVPTVLLLLGVGLACWWVGRVSLVEPLARQLRAWSVAAAVVAAAAWLSLGPLESVMTERFGRAAERLLGARVDRSGATATAAERADIIAWEPFTQERLETLVNEAKSVFVDFTADWCLTCKANELAAIERPEVARLLRANCVVALRADKTRPAPDVDAALRRLGNKAAAIPFYAFFPANAPTRPLLLDGIITSPAPIVQALLKAGASRGVKIAPAFPVTSSRN